MHGMLFMKAGINSDCETRQFWRASTQKVWVISHKQMVPLLDNDYRPFFQNMTLAKNLCVLKPVENDIKCIKQQNEEGLKDLQTSIRPGLSSTKISDSLCQVLSFHQGSRVSQLATLTNVTCFCDASALLFSSLRLLDDLNERDFWSTRSNAARSLPNERRSPIKHVREIENY